MAKVIYITFGNGETWRIPAQVVAEDMEQHFNQLDGGMKARLDSNGFVLDDALNDEAELILYMRFQMDWMLVLRHVRHTGIQATYDYIEAFDEATFEVVAG